MWYDTQVGGFVFLAAVLAASWALYRRLHKLDTHGGWDRAIAWSVGLALAPLTLIGIVMDALLGWALDAVFGSAPEQPARPPVPQDGPTKETRSIQQKKRPRPAGTQDLAVGAPDERPERLTGPLVRIRVPNEDDWGPRNN
jgi:hypothetical protein